MLLEPVEYLRPISDLHLNVDIGKRFKPEHLWMPPSLPTDQNTALVIAGDLWESKKFFSFSNYSWLKSVCANFKYVIVVLGNHDYYGGEIPAEHYKFEALKKEQGLANLFLLNNSTVSLGENLLIWGSTFWANFNEGDPRSTYFAKNGFSDNSFFNDFKYIRTGGYKKIGTNDLISEHLKAKNSLLQLKRAHPEQKVVVVTHHAPCYDSIPEEYRFKEVGDVDWHKAGAYFTDMTNFLETSQDVDLWIHGHTHRAKFYKKGNVPILVNPRGYGHHEKHPTEWNDKLVLAVKDL